MFSLIAIIGVVLIYLDYSSRCKELYLMGHAIRSKGLIGTGLWCGFTIEATLMFLHTPYGLDISFTVAQLKLISTYNIDSVITAVSILKLYFFIRIWPMFSIVSSERAIRVCELNGFEPNFHLFFKVALTQNPFWFLIFLFCLLSFSFGLLVQLFERGVRDFKKDSDDPFFYTWNPVWMVILAMTTVGYGDIYPYTHIGRVLTMFACYSGTIIVSLITVTIMQRISLSD